MRNSRRTACILFVISLVSFGIGYYLYDSYIEFLGIFEYYGIPETAYSQHSDTAVTIFNFKVGIVGALFGGVISLGFCLRFLFKSFSSNEQENN